MTWNWYRKKPVVVEAMRWDGSTADGREIAEWCDGRYWREGSSSGIDIHTLEGRMTAASGDWIIRGVRGEFYPCKPDIFEQTYEVAETFVVSYIVNSPELLDLLPAGTVIHTANEHTNVFQKDDYANASPLWLATNGHSFLPEEIEFPVVVLWTPEGEQTC